MPVFSTSFQVGRMDGKPLFQLFYSPVDRLTTEVTENILMDSAKNDKISTLYPFKNDNTNH